MIELTCGFAGVLRCCGFDMRQSGLTVWGECFNRKLLIAWKVRVGHFRCGRGLPLTFTGPRRTGYLRSADLRDVFEKICTRYLVTID